MDRPKLDLSQVAAIIDAEGKSYAIQHYLNSDDIEDPELAELWKTARDILYRIDQRLDGLYED